MTPEEQLAEKIREYYDQTAPAHGGAPPPEVEPQTTEAAVDERPRRRSSK